MSLKIKVMDTKFQLVIENQRELDLLRYLVLAFPDRGLSNQDLADLLSIMEALRSAKPF